jgi:YD repeat-containing protein
MLTLLVACASVGEVFDRLTAGALDEASAPASRECTITRATDVDGDGRFDETCVETWRGDERHVLRRDCVAADGREWGEENEWDEFDCPVRSLSWDSAGEVEIAYTCDEHHQVVHQSGPDGPVDYVNTYDAAGRILRHTIPGPDPEYAQYTDVYWWWTWSPDGRLLGEGFHVYNGGHHTTYDYDARGALVSGDYYEPIGHYPPIEQETFYDAFARPEVAYREEWGDETRFEWTYPDDDAMTAVTVRETEGSRVLWQETRTWTCP